MNAKKKLIYLIISYSACIDKMILLNCHGIKRIMEYLDHKIQINKENEKYSLTDILNSPEGFFKDKIFKIIYDTGSNSNIHTIHYVMLKFSKINTSRTN